MNDILRRAIEELEELGLPVDFIQIVKRDYSQYSTESSNSAANTMLNEIWWSSDVLDSLREFAADGITSDVQEVSSIGNLYHEAVHAYMDLNSDKHGFEQIAEHGREYYDDAPLDDGSTGSDSNRIFQEAIASYVAHRVTTWYHALDTLLSFERLLEENQDNARSELWYGRVALKVREISDTYNSAMAARSFGYQYVGPIWDRTQSHTTRRISNRMKSFADRVFLSDSVPENFSSCTKLKQIYDELLREINRQRQLIPVEIVGY